MIPEAGLPYSSIGALYCLGYVKDGISDVASQNLNKIFCEILQVLFPLLFKKKSSCAYYQMMVQI